MRDLNLSIRLGDLDDLAKVQKMFVDTISAACKDDYTAEQIKAWAASVEDKLRWTKRLTSQYFLVAELDNEIVGFASLEDSDYLDLLYVHKEYQRQGIADMLYSEIEKEAIKREAIVLNSDVSKTARRFFEKKGFLVILPQTNIVKNLEIVNYKMTKAL